MSKAIEIIEKPESISWEEITELLHKSYATRSKQSMTYLASYQTVEKTIERVGDGICYVALVDGKLAGTSTLSFKYNRKGQNYAEFCQVAVDPIYRGLGIGSKLTDIRIQKCKEANLNYLEASTSINASSIIDFWKTRYGAQMVGVDSYITTNYYSVIWRVYFKSPKRNKYINGIFYYLSHVKCILTKKENGEFRIWVKPLLKLRRALRSGR